jgi:imidazole glycerol phosphate synthase subunit HisF
MTTNVTSINARGFVVADFDTATFSLSFNEFAPKAREAKTKLKKGVEKITTAIDALKKKGLEILATHYRSNIAVQPNSVYNQGTHQWEVKGQKATYTVTFQTPTLEMVNEVYDVLSELDVNEYTVNSPAYSVRAEAALKQQALEDAWKVAQVLFANQCSVLGLDPKNYSVSTWQVNYSGNDHGGFSKGRNAMNSYAAGGSAGGGGEDDAIELNAGRAVVDVILIANYSKTGS